MRWHPLAPAEPGMGDNQQVDALQKRGDHYLFTAASQHGGVNQPGLSMQIPTTALKGKKENGADRNWLGGELVRGCECGEGKEIRLPR